MRCVCGDEVLMSLERQRVGRLEERACRVRVPARAAEPPALEVDAGRNDRARAPECGGFVEKSVARVEIALKPGDPCELREDLGAALVRRLRPELRLQASLCPVEIVEVPEGSKPVVHSRDPRARVPGYARQVEVVVIPETGEAERRALLVALEQADVRPAGAEPYGGAWRRAGLCEAVESDDGDAGYAFSPRRTRGATRA